MAYPLAILDTPIPTMGRPLTIGESQKLHRLADVPTTIGRTYCRVNADGQVFVGPGYGQRGGYDWRATSLTVREIDPVS